MLKTVIIYLWQIDGDIEKTIKFVDSLKIPYIAPSFGGCESIVDQPAIMSYWYVSDKIDHMFWICGLASMINHGYYRDLTQEERLKYGIKDNLVRFSFGVEDFEDVKADVLQALEAI